MNIHIASASLDDVQWAAARHLVDGVLTTHALMPTDEVLNEHERIAELCRSVTGSVFVSVHALTGADVYRDGRELAKISDNVVVQIPFVEDAIDAIHRLAAEGVRVAATLIYSAAQAILAARAGAKAVVISLDDLDLAGHDAIRVIRTLREAFTASGTECDVVAFGTRDAVQFAAAATAGADAIALAPETLRALLVHPLTDRGIDRFLRELSRQHTTWTVV